MPVQLGHESLTRRTCVDAPGADRRREAPVGGPRHNDDPLARDIHPRRDHLPDAVDLERQVGRRSRWSRAPGRRSANVVAPGGRTATRTWSSRRGGLAPRQRRDAVGVGRELQVVDVPLAVVDDRNTEARSRRTRGGDDGVPVALAVGLRPGDRDRPPGIRNHAQHVGILGRDRLRRRPRSGRRVPGRGGHHCAGRGVDLPHDRHGAVAVDGHDGVSHRLRRPRDGPRSGKSPVPPARVAARISSSGLSRSPRSSRHRPGGPPGPPSQETHP